jgi:hypothetical protein
MVESVVRADAVVVYSRRITDGDTVLSYVSTYAQSGDQFSAQIKTNRP